MDASQDVTLISGSEANGQTKISFKRKHNTCDDKDMVIGVRNPYKYNWLCKGLYLNRPIWGEGFMLGY